MVQISNRRVSVLRRRCGVSLSSAKSDSFDIRTVDVDPAAKIAPVASEAARE